MAAADIGYICIGSARFDAHQIKQDRRANIWTAVGNETNCAHRFARKSSILMAQRFENGDHEICMTPRGSQ